MFEVERKFRLSSKYNFEATLLDYGFEQERTLVTRTIYLPVEGPETLRIVVIKEDKKDIRYILGKKWSQKVGNTGVKERREQEEKISKFTSECLMNTAGNNILNLYKTRHKWKYRGNIITTVLNEVEVDIDVVDGFGTYVEIEVMAYKPEEVVGARTKVNEAATMLKLSDNQEVKDSYFTLLKHKTYNLHNTGSDYETC